MFGNKSALSWFVMLILLCGLSSFQIKHHWRIQTDILALLPEDERDSVVQTLRRIVSGHLGRTSLFLVSHVQSHTARDATRQLGKLMESSEVFSVVQWDYSQQQQTFFELYFPLRYRIISPTLRRYLDQNDGYKRLIQRLKRELYHPTSSFITRFLEDDPLLFFPELMKHWGQNTTRLHVEDGLLGTRHDGQYHYLITAQLARSPFEESVQDALEENWHKWTVNLRRTFPGLELTYTSVARFAASTRSQMQKDILFISTGSIIGIAFLIITTFRSIKHLFIALIPLAVGLWSALGLSLLIFGELHAITLVFGASLIGICVDYSFHYFAHHRVSLEWESKAAMRHILPALSLGGLTTLLSYTGLGLTPLVGLRQIAVFASCGILVSFFTVVVGFPLLLKDPHPRAHYLPLLYRGSQYFLSLWCRFRRPIFLLLIVVIVMGLKGMFGLQVNDSPRSLAALPGALAEKDRFIRNIIGESLTQQYLVIEGKTTEDVLQTLENLQAFMRTEVAQHWAEFGPMITTFLPSIKRQKEDTHAIRRLLEHKKEIAIELESLGFPDQKIQNFFQTIEHEPGAFLLPQQWLHHRASVGLRHLWLGETSQGAAILVPLQRVNDVQELQKAIASFQGVRYFDQIEDFTRILERYRKKAILLVSLAYLVIFVLLIWRYRVRGFLIILPPFLAALITLGVLGILGNPFNLMHCLALLLILGMGVDYTIFLVESDSSSEPTTLLALTLSSVTTLLSFGLLSFSSQAVLRAIGLTTLIGIFCAWLLSPLATYRRPL